MPSLYQRARFLLSVGKLSQLPPDEGFEVAFAGRSNAGKSSAINTLTHQRHLARTSKTPGRTQLLNFFQLDEQRYLVDLPGYGYAKVAQQVKQRWHKTLDGYLAKRRCLAGIVLLMDIRHPLKEFDLMMLDWCQQSDLPAHILLTKSDKLKKGAASNCLLKVRQILQEQYPVATVQLFSAHKKTGVEQLEQKLNDWFALEKKKAPVAK